MRIAQVAPLNESVPPLFYGGTERVVSYLTEEMVRQGHEVTLYASGDSQTSARLVAGCPRALWRDQQIRETLPHHVRLMELVFRDRDRFDILHFHCDFLHFPILRRYPCPSVTTLHGLVHPPDLEPLLREFDEMPLVSISDSQRRPLPWANWQATVYHGLPADLFSFHERPDDYWAFLGRISPDKGDRQGDRDRARVGEKAQGRGQDLSRGSGLLPAGDRPPDGRGRAASRVRRRGRRGGQGSVPRPGAGGAFSDRVAGAVRPGDDRGDGVRHARRRIPPRFGPRGHDGRCDRLRGRRCRRGGRGRRSGSGPRSPGMPGRL